GKLEPVSTTNIPHDRQVISIRGPIRRLHVFQHRAGRSAVEWHSGQRTHLGIRSGWAAIHRYRHFSGRGNSQKRRSPKIEGARLRAFGTGDEQIDGTSFPGSTINDGLPVGRKMRGLNGTSAKGELMVQGL